MGKKILFTPDQTQAILEDYRDRNITTKEITKKYFISVGTLARIVQANNEPLRNPNASKPRPRSPQATKYKSCPKCRKKIDLKGARFCPFCGADIRSENEVLAEKVIKQIELFKFLPETTRDDFVQTLNQAAAKLKTI